MPTSSTHLSEEGLGIPLPSLWASHPARHTWKGKHLGIPERRDTGPCCPPRMSCIPDSGCTEHISPFQLQRELSIFASLTSPCTQTEGDDLGHARRGHTETWKREV